MYIRMTKQIQDCKIFEIMCLNRMPSSEVMACMQRKKKSTSLIISAVLCILFHLSGSNLNKKKN